MTTPSPSSDALYWKRKLAAFLHDSPSKPLDIKSHEERADGALKRAGLKDDEGLKAYFDKGSDHTAAAADRLPFPHHATSGVRCAYDPEKNPFRHPLGAGQALARSDSLLTTGLAEDIEQNNQPGHLITGETEYSAADWRARFFAHWRVWRAHATETHAGFATLPADTRIPDHTIWTHMSVVSAIEGCDGEPALLKLQLGPVQDFIAAARSTRDLWSGSYLLSWLMAAGLARLAKEIGPDSVIFPNLWGQPLVDLHTKEIWERLRPNEKQQHSTWDDLGYPLAWSPRHPDQPLPLHTPNLPNVFLALVPASRARTLAEIVATAIRSEWQNICSKVRTYAEPLFTLREPTVAPNAAARFQSTTERHLDLAWKVTPVPHDLAELIALAERLLPHDHLEAAPTGNDAVRRVKTLVHYFTQHLPPEHRDGRYYEGGKSGPKDKLNNLGIAWSLAVALNSWELDAARSLRSFNGLPTSGANGNQVPSHGAKDALTGREPMLFGGSEDWLKAVHALPAPQHGDWKKLFRHRDEVGAITLVKRLWHLAYLHADWGLHPHPMPNTHELASGQTHRDDESNVDTLSEEDGKYYAVLAFDGDSIGQWVSGAKTPTFDSQLAQSGSESPDSYFTELDQNLLQKELGSDRLLSLQRPLSPSYHLQFSEALSNFALHCAPRVVARYGGKLLYAGGDDVLALVPATYALACADDLQRVFRGLGPRCDCGIKELSPGFLSIADDRAGRPIPLILPGPRATASVGLTIAHFKQPLQDVVREAQRAEKRAKKIAPGKHAVGLTLIKRSGETVAWNTRFDADKPPPASDSSHRGGLAAAQWLLFALGCDVGSLPDTPRPCGDEVLSSKFPHRLSALIEPYVGETDETGFDASAIFERELSHALDRQRGPSWGTDEAKETRARLAEHLKSYLASIPGSSSDKLHTLLGLLSATAFIARQRKLQS
jgi:CRISPR-associated protein Cmr2